MIKKIIISTFLLMFAYIAYYKFVVNHKQLNQMVQDINQLAENVHIKFYKSGYKDNLKGCPLKDTSVFPENFVWGKQFGITCLEYSKQGMASLMASESDDFFKIEFFSIGLDLCKGLEKAKYNDYFVKMEASCLYRYGSIGESNYIKFVFR